MTRRRALGLLGLVGAGAAGLAGAARALTGGFAPEPEVAEGTTRLVESYGELPRQIGEWWVPPGDGEERLPTVVLVHGGYWRAGFDLTLENAVAADLAARGFLCWNVDYRPSSDPWPATLTDVAAAYDHLAVGAYADRVDPERIAVVGHSAGGHLALWLASRSRLPAGAPGEPTGAPAPALAVPQAPVAALTAAYDAGLGGGAVEALMGGSPQEVPERYAAADPLVLVPTEVPSVLIHGTRDDVVPLLQSELYVATAQEAGEDCRLVTFAGGHFEHLDPSSTAVELLREALSRL